MTRNGVCERILFLRRRIAAIEAQGALAQGNLARPPVAPAQNPFELLLQNLGGGSLNEIIPPARATAPQLRASPAPRLRAVAARPRAVVVWISEDMAAREIGLPYGKGLEALGLDPARLVFVRTRNGAESLWAMEEALKSRAAAIVAESWVAPRAYDLSASRRLLLAARRGGGLGLLLLLRACGEAARLTSAAQLRFEIAAPLLPRGRRDSVTAAGRLPGACASPRRAPACPASAKSTRWPGATFPSIPRRPSSIMRFLSVFLPRLPTDRILRRREPEAAEAPFALWRKIKGGERSLR